MARLWASLRKPFVACSAAWDEFFFAAPDFFHVALFRFVVAMNMFVMYLLRHFDREFYFSDNGFIPFHRALEVLPEFYQPSVSALRVLGDVFGHLFNPLSDHLYSQGPGHLSSFLSGPIFFSLHWLFLVVLLALALGLVGRLGAVAAFVLHIIFLQRNLAIVYGADIVSTFWLFYLCFMRSNKELGLINYIKNRFWVHRRADRSNDSKRSPRGFNISYWVELARERSVVSRFKFISKMSSSLKSTSGSPLSLTGVGVRLAQIQLCIIYFYSGFEKLKGQPWWEGTAIWQVIGNDQLAMFNFAFLKSVPLLLTVATYITVLFEVYFPALVWFRRTRRWLLLLGIGLHIGIAVSIGLYFFSIAMLSVYILFLDSEKNREHR
jgi:hypothetical protein